MPTRAFYFTPREFSTVLAIVARGEGSPLLSATAIHPAARATVQKAAAYDGEVLLNPAHGWSVPGVGYLPPNVTPFTAQEVGHLLGAAAILAADSTFYTNLNLEGRAVALKTRVYAEVGGNWGLANI
jgi:hypothetical protein